MEQLFEQAQNPLHKLILIAISLKEVLAHQFQDIPGNPLPELDLPYIGLLQQDTFPTTSQGTPCYPGKELAGVAGLYDHLQERGCQVIFANDLSLDIHGIDAIAYDPQLDTYLLCEAKGTSGKIKNYPYYLKNTKTKGRQLSREWCWVSFTDCAFQGATAAIFLKLLRPVLDGNYRRLLSVTRLEDCQQGYCAVENRTWEEEEMSCSDWFAKPYNLEKQQRWMAEIEISADLSGCQ